MRTQPSPAVQTQHFGPAPVVQGMDDIKLMMAKMHGEDLLREAEHSRRAAAARRAVATRQPAHRLAARPAFWLAAVAGRILPTTAGR
jgi:hypothetical protein